jgi:hypothetical protein
VHMIKLTKEREIALTRGCIPIRIGIIFNGCSIILGIVPELSRTATIGNACKLSKLLTE